MKDIQKIKNLVWSGGGLRGICFIGVLKALEERGMIQSQIEKIAGTSIGALFSLLFCCGYTAEELREEIFNLNFKDLTSLSLIHLFKLKGLDNGQKVMTWLQKLIKAKGFSETITFKTLKELTNKELFITATNINKCHSEIFSYQNTPDLLVLSAIRMSIAIPFIFTPVLYEECHYVDGGLMNNFPLSVFKEEEEITLGITLQEDKTADKIEDIYQFGYSVIKCLSGRQHDKFPNIIIIKNPRNQSLNFSMSLEVRNEFYQSGRKTTLEFFEKD